MTATPLSPKALYARALRQPGFVSDPVQAQAIEALQQVFEALAAAPPRRGPFGRDRRAWPPVKGLYLWGGVGRGKTWLMDTFFESLPFRHKRRTHFHRFMLDVHERRQRFVDRRDPLKLVALEYAHEFRVLCFDEFHVSDIADAMILDRLTQALFAAGVTLVATSNSAPDALYRDGLQRENFLPAIARLKRHLSVLNLDSGVDYRLRQLTQAPLYLTPSDPAAERRLETDFERVAGAIGDGGTALAAFGRTIPARRLAEGVAWFEFPALCEGPRGTADYVEIARIHHTVLISGVPRLTVEHEDAARRFVSLVDEFYDRGVKLILAADVPLDGLYAGRKLAFEFQRTMSRLTEMQSREYLVRPHLP